MKAIAAIVAAFAVCVAAARPARAQAATASGLRGPAALRGLGVDEPIDRPSALLPALARTSPDLAGRPPAFARMIVPWHVIRDAVEAGAWLEIDARMNEYQAAAVPVILAVADTPLAASDAAAFVAAMHALATHLRGRVAVYQFDEATSAFDPAAAAYVLKLAAVQVRAADPGVSVAPLSVDMADTARQSALHALDVAPYVDIAAFRSAGAFAMAPEDAVVRAVQAADPAATTMVTGIGLPADPDTAAQAWVRGAVAELVGRARTATVVGTTDALRAVLAAEARLRDLFSADVVVMDAASVSLSVTGSGGLAAAGRYQLFYNLSTLATYLACWDTPAEDIHVSMQDAVGRRPTLRDPAAERVSTLPFTYDASGRWLRFDVPPAAHARLVDLDYGAAPVYVARTEVGAASALTVAEVISREQVTRAAQAERFRTYIAHARMEMHFRPTSTDAFQVVTENRFFAEPGTVEWDELSFTVNGTRWGPDRPAFPLLQAEKVLSLPLDLQFTADYRYRLEDADVVDGRRCYVVAFEPIRGAAVLYSGRVWIDAESFQRLRIDTVQAGGRAPVISSEETVRFESVGNGAEGWAGVFLPVHVTTKQIWLVAGQNLLVEKEVRYSAFEIDPPDFAARRASARASDHVMFRDTDQGLRYLARQGSGRVVSDRIAMSSKAMAMGATFDPSYSYPLPMFGIDYLNFAFGGPDTQLALLFAGVLALGNIQTSHVAGLPIDASVDFFGIAVPSNDIVVDAGGERTRERVLTIPGNVGANVGWQFTPFQKLKASYQFRYDFYFHDTATDPDFVVPTNTVTHGFGAGYEYKRHGYQVNVSGSAFHRMAAEPWGEPGALVTSRQGYQRYAMTLAKDYFATTFQTVHVSAGWYGGRNLDRFSMYQFGLFDEVRMHGVPSAGIKMSDLALVRGSYSFNVFEQYRLDLFVDEAYGTLFGDAAGRRFLTGTGAAVNFKAPWNTMFRIDVGKSVLPAPVEKAGSLVLQFMVLKPL